MIISSKLKHKRYKDGILVDRNFCSHYHPTHKDIVIYLPQVLQHSLDCKGVKPEDRIEQAFTQHVTHELIHKLLNEHIDYCANYKFDNLGFKLMYKIEGKFSLRNWFGGMLDKEV